MLPLRIPLADFHLWQHTLNNFIWDNKQHRISFKILRQPSTRGGLGIPDLKCYFEAAISRMSAQQQEINWMRIEFRDLKDLIGYDLLRQTRKQRKSLNITNTYLTEMLRIWDVWKPKLTQRISSLMTLTHHGCFNADLERIVRTGGERME